MYVNCTLLRLYVYIYVYIICISYIDRIDNVYINTNIRIVMMHCFPPYQLWWVCVKMHCSGIELEYIIRCELPSLGLCLKETV